MSTRDTLLGTARYNGLDLARFIDFLGMALVNFKVATGAGPEGASQFLLLIRTGHFES